MLFDPFIFLKKIILRKLSFSIFLLLFSLFSGNVWACDSCGCTLARVGSEGKFSEYAQPFFFDFTFEGQIWQKRDAAAAHRLHHQGHDAHAKTHEEFYHFGLGANITDRISLLAELPYVVRHALEVDDHEHLGERQRSEGFGDLSLTGIFKLLKGENDFIGPVAGIKFPTGRTSEKNKQSEKFEPELQPGSGSFDTTLGAAYQYQLSRIVFHGNVLYAIRTKGAQEFRYGNLFSSYNYADFLMNPKSKYFQSKVGIVSVYQIESHQQSHGEKAVDSGGVTLLLGPEISVQGNDHVSIFGNFLFPAYQNLGGVHQEIQYVWNGGVKISF